MKVWIIEHREPVFYQVKARTYEEAVKKVNSGTVAPSIYASDFIRFIHKQGMNAIRNEKRREKRESKLSGNRVRGKR